MSPTRRKLISTTSTSSMDTAYYNAYAIHLGYLGASSLPSSLAYPALPRLDLTIEPRQRVRLVLALSERRLNQWQDKTR